MIRKKNKVFGINKESFILKDSKMITIGMN